MKYECKENDCLIEMGRDKGEILISVQGGTAKTVIGLKDLTQALILFGVGSSEANWCMRCNKPIRIYNNTLQPLCECEHSEVAICECGGNERVALDCTMKPCKHPKYNIK